MALPARAEERPKPTPAELLRASRVGAVAERNTGWALAGAGLALAFSGSVALGVGLGGGSRFNEGAALETSGIAVLSSSLLLLIPGVVLAVHGQDRLSDIDWRLRAIAGAGFAAPLRGGGFLVGAKLYF